MTTPPALGQSGPSPSKELTNTNAEKALTRVPDRLQERDIRGPNQVSESHSSRTSDSLGGAPATDHRQGERTGTSTCLSPKTREAMIQVTEEEFRQHRLALDRNREGEKEKEGDEELSMLKTREEMVRRMDMEFERRLMSRRRVGSIEDLRRMYREERERR